LVILSKDWLRLRIGKLGIHDLPPGYYVYVGSALAGLHGRLKHHLKSEKRLHWHIDYLLQQATVAQIWCALGEDRLECTWNAILAELPGAAPIVPSFGSSDCRCHTHLTHFLTAPSLSGFRQELRQSNLPRVRRLNKMSDCDSCLFYRVLHGGLTCSFSPHIRI
jgi:Uri superfamily endonuclease